MSGWLLIRPVRLGARIRLIAMAAAVVTGLGGPLFPSHSHQAAPPSATLVSVQKLWDAAPHNAFTDLLRFRGEWFCVFREGAAHASPDGALRVLSSPDGVRWRSVARLTLSDADLRDAKLSETPDGRLLLNGAAALHQLSPIRHQSYAWFSSQGSEWSAGSRGAPDGREDADCALLAGPRRPGYASGVSHPSLRGRHQLLRLRLARWTALGELLLLARGEGRCLSGEGADSSDRWELTWRHWPASSRTAATSACANP